ncbi:hypothetical protein BLA39750_01283 [Burkholderia lata]|uniref:Uncharacterized protein n=1 Tax=Burkholderia lata (strain ATCC 17760 / DSM 23089 / LMG 22485 / NCIMB 9086 / R18194 / 383) TaxID=482957 RepID=A0A6P2V7H6_BURL3|nr:hypothetical protein [Burkholderia lata]VWC82153.1 hypothetical protein BLA39750_01283 [Burkholderia lata]
MKSKIEGKVLETDDFVTHRKAWRDALLIVRDSGCYVGLNDGPLSWDISLQTFDEAFGLYAPGSIPDAFRSNHEAWRLALTVAQDLAKVQGPDVDDKAYWEHEIRAFDRAFASVGIRLADGKVPELAELGVESLRAGDKVDLTSCPFLKESASADFEFAVVESVERETAGCVVVSYEDYQVVGYPVGCKLKVCSETLGHRKQPETSDHATGAGHLNGQIVEAPDLIATLDKAESFIVGFEGDQLQEGIDDLLREIRTAKGALKAQRKLPEIGLPPDMKPIGALMEVDFKKHLAEEGEPPALPADPEGKNDDRASWAGTAINAFQQATRCEDGDAVADLLASLMHHCDRNGLSFETELGRARQHYAEETSEASTEAVSPSL